MKKLVKKWIFPVFCVFSVLVSCAPSAYAVDSIVDFYDQDSVNSWNSLFTNSNPNALFMNYLAQKFGCSGSDAVWAFINLSIDAARPSGGGRGETPIQYLNIMAENLNKIFKNSPKASIFADWFTGFKDSSNLTVWEYLYGVREPNFQVREDGTSGQMRIRDLSNNIWVVWSDGRYPYAVNAGSDLPASQQNRWIDARAFASNPTNEKVNMLSYDILSAMCAQLNELGTACKIVGVGTYKMIAQVSTGKYYADAEGRPFACWANEAQAAVNQDRTDTTVVDGNGNIISGGDLDNSTDNSTNIDLSNMTITMPDGKIFIADQIIYDESTKTYNIDSHDVTNNNYTYYYTWNYYINYTSITYIGQTEEYNKYYEVYYELPDGRDSADLTAEEVEQLNVSVDVIPYGRSADDVSLRSLYHFDGDTKDSSYWNYCTDFVWNTGASLTYMDAGVFEGALYLDETEHDFTLILPGSITSGDFTFQFRYYQSYTAAPQTDSYICLGSSPVLWFNGSTMGYGSRSSDTTQLSVVSIGSWNEIALVRNNGTLYYYLNGVCVGSVSDHNAYAGSITFHFGADQQTYKYLDELRFVSKALIDGGSNYICSAVPYDTNLTLVLPDTVVPVADEYWSVTHTDGYIQYLDFTAGVFPDDVAYSSKESSDASYRYPAWKYTDPSSLFMCDSYAVLSGPLVTTIAGKSTYYLDRGTYTISVLFADGSVSSWTFDCAKSSSESFSWGTIGIYYYYNTSATTHYALKIIPESSIDILGVELVEGESADLSAEWIESVTVMDKDSLHTPSLAVRTDLDITSYQIGGVRPSIPTKGQVWAMVESGYITSIQIYNGSAWEACDGRIWTGERWIPYSSYNIITLQDMYDIVDATQNYEYIYSESGFWSWWQKSWNAFVEKLFSALGSGISGSSASGALQETVVNALSALIEGIISLITEVLKALIGAAADLLTGIFSFLTETVLGGIKDFFSIFSDGSLLEGFQQTGEDGSSTIGLPEGVGTVFAFFSGVIMLLPTELRSILFFGIALMLFMAVLKMVKE